MFALRGFGSLKTDCRRVLQQLRNLDAQVREHALFAGHFQKADSFQLFQRVMHARLRRSGQFDHVRYAQYPFFQVDDEEVLLALG